MKLDKTAQEYFRGRSAKVFWNLVSTNIGWLACVLGAAQGRHWLGLVVVPILFVIHIMAVERHETRKIIILALATIAIGFVVDTVLIIAGTVQPNRWLLPVPFTTMWDILIWANFSLTLNTSLRFLQKRPLAAAILGAACAPGTYYAADRLGALQFSEPIFYSLMWVGVIWLFAMPLLNSIAMRFYHGQEPESMRD
jgi:hypothetical protein